MKAAVLKTAKKLPPLKLSFGTGFIILFSIIYFFDDTGLIISMIPAVLVHELAHMAALVALGAPPCRLEAGLGGFSMDYSGELSFWGSIISALSGPFAGLAFAWGCAFFGNRLESEFLLLSAGVGFVINAFNLLPALPLDGGRALSCALKKAIGEKAERRVMLALGILIGLALIVSGIIFFAKGFGFALVPSGVWLLVLQKNEHL